MTRQQIFTQKKTVALNKKSDCRQYLYISVFYADDLRRLSVYQRGIRVFADKRDVPIIAAVGIYGVGNQTHINLAIESPALFQRFQLFLHQMFNRYLHRLSLHLRFHTSLKIALFTQPLTAIFQLPINFLHQLSSQMHSIYFHLPIWALKCHISNFTIIAFDSAPLR